MLGVCIMPRILVMPAVVSQCCCCCLLLQELALLRRAQGQEGEAAQLERTVKRLNAGRRSQLRAVRRAPLPLPPVGADGASGWKSRGEASAHGV